MFQKYDGKVLELFQERSILLRPLAFCLSSTGCRRSLYLCTRLEDGGPNRRCVCGKYVAQLPQGVMGNEHILDTDGYHGNFRLYQLFS
jgi:hypothetical protein